MFSSVFLFIMLLAFKHMHLISDLDVFPCIPLHLLSSCTFRAFFDKPPCPTSLNIVLYPSHWQPPLTVPRQKHVVRDITILTLPNIKSHDHIYCQISKNLCRSSYAASVYCLVIFINSSHASLLLILVF